MTQNGPNAATRVSGAIAIRAAIDVDGTLRVHRVPLKNRVASVQTVAAGGGQVVVNLVILVTLLAWKPASGPEFSGKLLPLPPFLRR